MPSAWAGRRTDTAVGPVISTAPPVAEASEVRLLTAGRVATVCPAPSSSAQPVEPVKPAPVSFVVQPSVGPAGSVFAVMTAAYVTPVTGAPRPPAPTSTMAAAVPGTPAGTVTTSVVSLPQRTGAVLPPTVAVSLFAANAVAVEPKPDPVTGTAVPPAAEAAVAVVVAVTGVR